jgi:uracil-DNA glycosylase
LKTIDIISSFCEVVACEECDSFTSKKLLRDKRENIPQPGYVGSNYPSKRVLLVGQNPGIAPDYMQMRDSIYTKALRDLESERTQGYYEILYKVVLDCVPEWPVNRNYFPLESCGLRLEDIAYCNVVRCRTVDKAIPSKGLIENCIRNHFINFVEAIEPKIVIFIGKWAHDQAAHLLPSSVKYSFLNRMRSLSSEERQKNKNEVVSLVKSCVCTNP